jgi:hypothetical protein
VYGHAALRLRIDSRSEYAARVTDWAAYHAVRSVATSDAGSVLMLIRVVIS